MVYFGDPIDYTRPLRSGSWELIWELMEWCCSVP